MSNFEQMNATDTHGSHLMEMSQSDLSPSLKEINAAKGISSSVDLNTRQSESATHLDFSNPYTNFKNTGTNGDQICHAWELNPKAAFGAHDATEGKEADNLDPKKIGGDLGRYKKETGDETHGSFIDADGRSRELPHFLKPIVIHPGQNSKEDVIVHEKPGTHEKIVIDSPPGSTEKIEINPMPGKNETEITISTQQGHHRLSPDVIGILPGSEFKTDESPKLIPPDFIPHEPSKRLPPEFSPHIGKIIPLSYEN